MTEFRTWHEARAYAEEKASEYGVAYGIEKPTQFAGWTVKMLPRKENRYGWELRCEAVEPPWVDHSDACMHKRQGDDSRPCSPACPARGR
jgi:hypothetical protein